MRAGNSYRAYRMTSLPRRLYYKTKRIITKPIRRRRATTTTRPTTNTRPATTHRPKVRYQYFQFVILLDLTYLVFL